MCLLFSTLLEQTRRPGWRPELRAPDAAIEEANARIYDRDAICHIDAVARNIERLVCHTSK